MTLFEKSRGIGGRCSVKRHSDYKSFNIGAQFLTNKNPELSRFFSFLKNKSLISLIDDPVGYCHTDGVFSEAKKVERFIGKPSMNSFLKKWSAKASLVFRAQIQNIYYQEKQWVLEDKKNKKYKNFDACIFSLPYNQGISLWEINSELKVPKTQMFPCWTLMLVTKDIKCEYSSAFLNFKSLSWYSSSLLEDGSRKWVVHASSEWSQENFEREEFFVKKMMLQDLDSLMKTSLQVDFFQLHRWRYASSCSSAKDFSLWDQSKALGYIGDWFCGGRIEGGMTSALNLFRKIENELL